MLGFVLAATVAAALGFFEQASRFGLRKLQFGRGAWKFWVVRLSVEAAVAMLALAVARGVDVAHANEAWAGPIAALITAAGLRSSFIDWGETPVGLRSATDPARRWIQSRVEVRGALIAATHVVADVFPAIEASSITVQQVGDHLLEVGRRLLDPADVPGGCPVARRT